MKANSKFDYIIVGAGLSGLHLAYSFTQDDYFKNYKILVVDNSKSKKKDNYFSFWEKGTGNWDSILKKSWRNGKFYSKYGNVNMDFSNYKYKTLSSSDFSNFVKKKAEKKLIFTSDTIINIREENGQVIVVGNKKNYYSSHVFDSRPNKNFKKEFNKYISIKQHFLGWIIKTKENKFDKNSFVFMDYRIRDKNSTAFTYVLPFKSNKALIEHTYFSKNECEKKVYESYIEEYIQNYYSNSDYEIIKSESGVIPMTSYPFYKDSSKKITRIGTSGGWIKPTTGYSFSNCEKYSMKILEHIKKGQNPTIISKKKYRFLDKIFLGVLSLYNDKGELIFYKMIKKNKTQTILRFLNEESSLMDEIKIIFSLRSMDFIKVFIQSLYKKGL
jgi:lycopene beta-cyclase